MHRLFVAIRPPAVIREQLLDLMEGVTGARWQDDDQLHLTLRFIGEVEAGVADDVIAALRQVRHPGFEIALDGLDQFTGKTGPRALWAGVRPHEPLMHLHRKVDQALVRAGLEPERRAYLPHITLARTGRDTGPLQGYFARHSGLGSPLFPVTHFAVYESTLSHSGAIYEIVERYPLDTI